MNPYVLSSRFLGEHACKRNCTCMPILVKIVPSHTIGREAYKCDKTFSVFELEQLVLYTNRLEFSINYKC